MIRTLPLALLFLVAGCGASSDGTEPLVVQTAKGAHRFKVEMALTPESQEKGLMGRTSLDDDRGMVFPMMPPRTASFWMKDTPLPLDILFIHTDGSIAAIFPNTTPYSREPVSAGVPVAGVLELRGGRAAELGIAEGDRVNWGACVDEQPGKAASAEPTNFCPAKAP